MKYPEHDKMYDVKELSQAIGEFLEMSGYDLCEPTGRDYIPYVPVNKSITEILAEWFEIDLDKLEKEKRQMLEQLRND